MEIEIKKFRNLTNMSQQQFANHFSIPLGTLRNWEQGIAKAPEYVLKMIIENIRRDKMINVETIKLVSMLNELAELTKGGIFEFKKATQDDSNYSKVFYDQETQDSDGNCKVVLDMCIVDNPECTHHDAVSYYDSCTEEFTVRAVINENEPYIVVKFLNSEDQIVVEDGRWYFT